MNPKKVAIVQSNYIPWKGYFDLIHSVDEFILYDSAQYTKRDWRNRNKIKTPNGSTWLSIPVEVKGKYLQKIHQTQTSGDDWRKQHWASLQNFYSKAPFFKTLEPELKSLYLDQQTTSLSEINFQFIQFICKSLEIETPITWSMDYKLEANEPTEKLLELCIQAEATEYISGPSAKNYMDTDIFSNKGISVHFYNYDDYPVYDQLFGEFDHYVTILDLLFMKGPEARSFMKSFN